MQNKARDNSDAVIGQKRPRPDDLTKAVKNKNQSKKRPRVSEKQDSPNGLPTGIT